MASYQENILTYLKRGGVITPAIAATEFNCYCLAAVIKKLRDKGNNILARTIQGTSSKEYYIEDKSSEQ